MVMKISGACGHSKYDTIGKQDPEGMKEWEYTDKIIRYFFDMLKDYEGVETRRFDDPTGKVDYPLPQRYNAINTWGADVHIDFHLNAFGNGGWSNAKGIETFTSESKPKEAVQLATKVQKNLVNELRFADRGVKHVNWDMVYFTKMDAILIEFAFMTNKEEAYKMRTAEYQKKAAKAVVDALVAQYGLKKKAAKTASVEVEKKDEPRNEGGRKLNLNQRQLHEIANIYSVAAQRGIFSSHEHAKKMDKGELTIDEVLYLNSLLIGKLMGVERK